MTQKNCCRFWCALNGGTLFMPHICGGFNLAPHRVFCQFIYVISPYACSPCSLGYFVRWGTWYNLQEFSYAFKTAFDESTVDGAFDFITRVAIAFCSQTLKDPSIHGCSLHAKKHEYVNIFGTRLLSSFNVSCYQTVRNYPGSIVIALAIRSHSSWISSRDVATSLFKSPPRRAAGYLVAVGMQFAMYPLVI